MDSQKEVTEIYVDDLIKRLESHPNNKKEILNSFLIQFEKEIIRRQIYKNLSNNALKDVSNVFAKEYLES